MQEKVIARRYAEALYDFAEESKKLNAVMDDCAALAEFLGHSKEFETLIHNPTIDSTKKIDVLRNVFKTKLSPTTFIFLQFLVVKRRLNLLKSVADQFELVCHERKDTLKAKIISAVKLSEAQVKKICTKLKPKFKKDILPTLEEDQSLVAGFKVQIADQMYDNSIRYQLDKFKTEFMCT